MKRALLIFTVFIALSFGTSAQEQPKPAEPATNSTPAPLQPIRVQGEALTQLVLAETQLDAARNALQAAQLNLEVKQRQLLESLGGSSVDYETQPKLIGQGAVAFVPKAAKK
jgi:hypothetical protein